MGDGDIIDGVYLDYAGGSFLPVGFETDEDRKVALEALAAAVRLAEEHRRWAEALFALLDAVREFGSAYRDPGVDGNGLVFYINQLDEALARVDAVMEQEKIDE